MNNKLNYEYDLIEKINLELEAFRDDILPAIGAKDFIITAKFFNAPFSLTLSWQWNVLDEREQTKVFNLDVLDSEESFVNRVKGYLFDLTVTLINL